MYYYDFVGEKKKQILSELAEMRRKENRLKED
jgi:hypothetical protein